MIFGQQVSREATMNLLVPSLYVVSIYLNIYLYTVQIVMESSSIHSLPANIIIILCPPKPDRGLFRPPPPPSSLQPNRKPLRRFVNKLNTIYLQWGTMQRWWWRRRRRPSRSICMLFLWYLLASDYNSKGNTNNNNRHDHCKVTNCNWIVWLARAESRAVWLAQLLN